ncbi:hypothetical protein RND81_10G212600 [Saponaria officinalis]|uniref:Pentatricopeptide repeat-containing protein n=1 Tax=Saponaria officinalis TaxID=3572 RepID=A0AAW1I762_SAPOF
MLSCYLRNSDVDGAKLLFKQLPIKSVVARTVLITGYMKVGNVERMFEDVPAKNVVVSWNAMIAGYVENSRENDAMKHFKKMVEFGVKSSPLTLASVLLGCSNPPTLILGKQIHQFMYKTPLYLETTVGTSLLSMYCKCGVLDNAWKLFSEIPRKDLVTWNSMISCYAAYDCLIK